MTGGESHALQINPNLVTAHENRDLAYKKLRNNDNPDYQNAEDYNNQGVTYFQSKQYDEAIIYFTKATEINPQDAVAYFNIGAVYQELKQIVIEVLSSAN